MSEKDLNKELDKNTEPENAGEEQQTQQLNDTESPSEPAEQDTAELEQPAENGADADKTENGSGAGSGGVAYEQNDNWQFDASAPAAENSVLEGANGAEFEFESAPQSSAENVSMPQGDVDTAIKPQNIVIKKERVSVILSTLLALVIIAVLVILGVRYYTVPNSNEKMNPGNIAMTVGDIDVSVGLYNYYYDSIVYEYTYYANYGYYDLDSTQDFSTQYTTDSDGNEISWLDLFEQTTKERIKLNTMYYELGLEAGITLTQEQQEEIESQLDMVRESASEEGLSANEYSQQIFGAYCGLETLRNYMEQYYIAGTYYNQYAITERPTDDEVNAYFSEHEDDYKSCSFALLEMNYDTTDDTTKQQSIDNAEAYMQQITDVESMRALIPEACAALIDNFISAGYFETEEEAVSALSESIEATQARVDVETSFGEEVAQWMFDENTAVGSTTYYANEDVGVVYVILKTSQPFLVEDSQVYSVRHILVMPESESESDSTTDSSSSTTEYTEEEWNAAYEKAQQILDEFNAGGKTELSFALLAEEYSDDTESTSSGSSGLYGGGYMGVTSGQMVEEFEDWAMDADRAYGDTDIVRSEHGYHIMYFISRSAEYMYDAQQDCFNEQSLQMLDATELKDGLGIKNVNYADPNSDYVAAQQTSY